MDRFEYDARELRVIGGINGNLASEAAEKFYQFTLTFFDVLAIKVFELDSWDYECESSFDDVVESEWNKVLGGKVTSNHKHYQLQTYDDVIEVMASKFTMDINYEEN